MVTVLVPVVERRIAICYSFSYSVLLYSRRDDGLYFRDAQISFRRHSNVAARLRKALTDYTANPAAHANNVTLLPGTAAKRMRVGDYRIIFE
jgi:mRNA interferase RelE/StbE